MLSSNVSTEYPKNIPVLMNQIGSLICGNSVAGKTPNLVVAITSKQTTYESNFAGAGFDGLKHFMFSLE